MATRRATKDYQTIEEFFTDYETTLSKFMIELDSGCYRGDALADQVKIDLRFPDKKRIGPIDGQVIFRGAEGKTALRLMELPNELGELYNSLKQKEEERNIQEEKAKQVAEEQKRNAVLSEVGKFIEEGLVIAMDAHLAIVEQLETQIEKLEAELAGYRSGSVNIPESQSYALEQDSSVSTSSKIKRGFIVPSTKGKQAIVFGQMETMFQRFLLQVQEKQWTGIVIIKEAEVQRVGFFMNGGIVGFQATPMITDERLGNLLLKNKQITNEQLRAAIQIMDNKDCLQGEAFVEMGLMNENQLEVVLKKQSEYILLKLLASNAGSFQFFKVDIDEKQFQSQPLFPINLLYQKYLERAKGMPANEFSKAMTAHLGDEVSFSTQAKTLLEQIDWKNKEKDLLKEISVGTNTLRDLFTRSSLGKGHTSALLWALLQLRFLAFTKKAGATGQASAKENQESMLLKIRQIQKGNFFDILEVHWICLSSEIELAYQKLRAEFDPQNPKWKGVEVSRLNAINRELQIAYQRLSDDSLRREYRAKLVKQKMILQSASLLGQKGKMAISKGNKREAVLCFSKALELNPGQADLMQGLQKASSL